MTRSPKGLLIAPLLLSMMLTAAPAQACVKLRFEDVLRLMDSFEAAFRVRVMQATVRPLSDLGIDCKVETDIERCDVLELNLKILEDFKGNGKEYTTIYAPVLPVCRDAILPGLEYVFFLTDFEGLIGPDEDSFLIRGEASNGKLAKLREWKPAQPY